MDAWHDHQVREEEADESVATECTDVRANDRVDLADEGLDEAVEAANLGEHHLTVLSSAGWNHLLNLETSNLRVMVSHQTCFFDQ